MRKQNIEKTKTILISIFEGVEAKNIIRTAILPTLLSDQRVRVVLFTDNNERAAYYQKEFQDDRLIYEVVKLQPPSYFDRFLSKIKFTLLRTETTKLERQMLREEGRNIFLYWMGVCMNVAFARKSVRRVVRWLDFLLVRDQSYATYFHTYSPDLVFLAFLFGEKETHLLREAKRCGVKSVALINSWDHATSRCALRLLSDAFVVYNPVVKQELVEFHDVDPRRIYVGGIAQYDEYYTHQPKSRDVFFQDIHADPGKKLVIYASMGRAFSSSEWKMIDLLHDLNARGVFGNDVEILVRFQPNDFVDEEELQKRPNLCYDYPGTRFTTSRGVGIDWDMSKKEVQHLADTLYHADLLISYTSSIAIDAAIFDTPIINLDFSTGVHKVLRGSPMQFYSTVHYQNALATGAIRLVSSMEELGREVRRYLSDPALDREGREKLVETQCCYTDGKSGERIGRFLLQQL